MDLRVGSACADVEGSPSPISGSTARDLPIACGPDGRTELTNAMWEIASRSDAGSELPTRGLRASETTLKCACEAPDLRSPRRVEKGRPRGDTTPASRNGTDRIGKHPWDSKHTGTKTAVPADRSPSNGSHGCDKSPQSEGPCAENRFERPERVRRPAAQ